MSAGEDTLKLLRQLRRSVEKWAGHEISPEAFANAIDEHRTLKTHHRIVAHTKMYSQQQLTQCVKLLRSYGLEWPINVPSPNPPVTTTSPVKSQPRRSQPGKTPITDAGQRNRDLFPDEEPGAL